MLTTLSYVFVPHVKKNIYHDLFVGNNTGRLVYSMRLKCHLKMNVFLFT